MSNIKRIYFTSDWHIGHEKAIVYDKRPFKNLDHMHKSLIKNFNETVSDSSVTYFLGDMGNKTQEIKDVIAKLNGTKVLVLGNHDHNMHTMYNCGFDVVVNSISMYVHGELLTASHCPLPGLFREDVTGMNNVNITDKWHGETREKNKKFMIQNVGQFHLHGHIHSRKDKTISKRIEGKQFDVGVTANHYRPVSLSEVESWIMKYSKG